MTEILSIMAKICNINFWIENDPPPFWMFSENSYVLLAPPVSYKVSGANIKEADLRHSVEGHHTA